MKPISFYLVTDTHYFENSLGAGGEAFEKNMVTEQYFVKESSAIVKATFERISKDDETDIATISNSSIDSTAAANGKGYLLTVFGETKFTGTNVFDGVVLFKEDAVGTIHIRILKILCGLLRHYAPDAIHIPAVKTQIRQQMLFLCIGHFYTPFQGILSHK